MVGDVISVSKQYKKCLFGALIGVMTGFQGGAAQAEVLKYRVSSRYVQDSNLFRFADASEAQAAIGSTDMKESYYTIGAGLEAKVPVSRQSFFVDADVETFRYDRFSNLDYTAVSGKAGWDWVAGSQWSGQLLYRRNERLIRFLESTSVVKDIRVVDDVGVRGAYRLHPDWTLGGGLKRYSRRHDIQTRFSFDEKMGFVEVLYDTDSRTRVGLRQSVVKGTFEEQELVGTTLVDNDYTQRASSVLLYWEGSKKSRFNGWFGLTRRDHDQFPERDFDGVTWRANYHWLPTAKLTLNLGLWQQTETPEERTSFVETFGFEANSAWRLSAKLSFRLGYQRRDEDFKGRVLVSGDIRQDTLTRWTLGAHYRLREKWIFSLDYMDLTRESNVPASQFDARRVTLRVRMVF